MFRCEPSLTFTDVCRSREDGPMSELIVVTVIVAAEGGVKVPKITSREELTRALNKLGALRDEQVHLESQGHGVCCMHVMDTM